MRTLSVLILLLVAGCAVPIKPEPFTGPSGRQAYTMACSGMGRTLAQCYQKAGELCPSGYNIVDRVSSVGGYPNGMAFTSQRLVVECVN